MNEYNFSGVITMPDGTEALENGKSISLYELLGNMLLGKTEGIDAFKAIGWATELTKESRALSLDDSDKGKLEKLINDSQFGNLAKYHLLKVLKGA